MKTYNCARVYVGDYSYSKVHTYPETAPGGTYESCEQASCRYRTLRGSIIIKQLRPTKVRVASGESPSPIAYHTLRRVLLSPRTDEAIIAVFNRKGKRLVKLIKHQQGLHNTIFKARF